MGNRREAKKPVRHKRGLTDTNQHPWLIRQAFDVNLHLVIRRKHVGYSALISTLTEPLTDLFRLYRMTICT